MGVKDKECSYVSNAPPPASPQEPLVALLEGRLQEEFCYKFHGDYNRQSRTMY